MIKHERWVTGKTVSEPDDAIIYYKDYGDSVVMTDWKQMPGFQRGSIISKELFDSVVKNIETLLKIQQSGKINEIPNDPDPELKYVVITVDKQEVK